MITVAGRLCETAHNNQINKEGASAALIIQSLMFLV